MSITGELYLRLFPRPTNGSRCVNAGALAGIATTFMEKDVGFWAAFLMPSSVLATALVVFFLNGSRFGKSSPQASLSSTAYIISRPSP